MALQGQTVIERSNKFGQSKVEHELQTARSDFDDWKKQLDEADTMLDKCMTLSDSFDDQYESLSRWIGERDAMLKMEVGLLASVEEKTLKLQQMQTLRQEVLSRQAHLDEVNIQVQQLMAINTDLRVSHRVAQLSTRYQALVTLAGVRIYFFCTRN